MTNLIDLIYYCVGFIVNHIFLIDKFLKEAKPADLDNPTEKYMEAEKTATEEAYIEMEFLSGLN